MHSLHALPPSHRVAPTCAAVVMMGSNSVGPDSLTLDSVCLQQQGKRKQGCASRLAACTATPSAFAKSRPPSTTST